MQAFIDHMQEWCKKNKACFYIDHRDELTQEQVQGIIEAAQKETKEKRQEALWGVSGAIFENCLDWQCDIEKQEWEECKEDFDGELPEDFDEDGEFFDAFRMEYLQWEGDLLDDLARNTRGPNIVAYPEINGERLDAEATAEALGCDVEAIAPTYESECLAVCGTIDLQEIIENIKEGKRLLSVTITPEDSKQLLMHCGWHGSGNQGDIKPTKTATMPAQFVFDESRKYGVDAVYGFVGSFWGYNLKTVWVDDNNVKA